jgi:hypothetical protein
MHNTALNQAMLSLKKNKNLEVVNMQEAYTQQLIQKAADTATLQVVMQLLMNIQIVHFAEHKPNNFTHAHCTYKNKFPQIHRKAIKYRLNIDT